MPRSEEREPTLKGGPSLPGGDEWQKGLFLWKKPSEEARGFFTFASKSSQLAGGYFDSQGFTGGGDFQYAKPEAVGYIPRSFAGESVLCEGLLYSLLKRRRDILRRLDDSFGRLVTEEPNWHFTTLTSRVSMVNPTSSGADL